MSDTFTCEVCGETYEKGWTDEEAIAEQLEVFGTTSEDDGVACEDCYAAVMRSLNN